VPCSNCKYLRVKVDKYTTFEQHLCRCKDSTEYDKEVIDHHSCDSYTLPKAKTVKNNHSVKTKKK
jgi:hypothetical protein